MSDWNFDWIIASVCRNVRRIGLRILSEKRAESEGAESTSWLCIRCHGGGIRLVASDSGNGYVRGYVKTGICTGTGRTDFWFSVFASDGYPRSAYASRKG